MTKTQSFIIDWMSLTLWGEASPQWAEDTFMVEGFARASGRRPYRSSVKTEGITFYYTDEEHTDKIMGLLEVSGGGMPRLSDDVLMALLAGYKRFTRIDLALDYEGTHPRDLVTETKPHAVFDTNTGYTIYLGSPKSDTFVRVYRYHEPHPRAKKTRVEFVFRRHIAKTIAEAIHNGHLDRVEATLTRIARRKRVNIGLPENGALAFATSEAKGSKDLAGKIIWLKKQVAPAIKSMRESGVKESDILEYLGMVKK